MRSLVLPLTVALCLVAVPALAAEPSNDPAAEKARGDAAMDGLHMDEALEAYTHAYELGHDPAVLYNRGRVFQARGDYAKALDDLEAFDRDASPTLKTKVPKLQELIADVRAHVSTLTIKSNVDGAHVTFRNVDLGVTPLQPLRTNPGPASLRVEAPDYVPWTLDKPLDAGATLLDVQLVKKSAAAPIVVAAAPDDNGKSVTSKWWFWAGVGIVAVAAVVTIVVVTQTEKSPSTGSGFSPGRVSGPLVVQF